MKLRVFYRREDGAVAVIVALCMTALLGFTALGVDFGMLAVSRQTLQNAADAAALAGAGDLMNNENGSVMQTVNDYCAANGCTPGIDGVSLDVQMTAKTVTVTLHREMVMGFSGVLTGKNRRTVTAAATAQALSFFAEYPYAIFAGKRIEDSGTGIAVYGNDHPKVNGSIHSNSSITFADVTVRNGTVTAAGRIEPSIEGGRDNWPPKDMPDYDSFEASLSHQADIVEMPGDYIQNGTSCFKMLLDDAAKAYKRQYGREHGDQLTIHIGGSLIFNGWNPATIQRDFPVTLIVDGDVSLNGAPLQGSLDFPVYVISKTGNITIMGGALDFFGILYAPKGDVTFMGINVNYYGSIIAQNFIKSGGTFHINYEENLDRFLPKTKVRLIA